MEIKRNSLVILIFWIIVTATLLPYLEHVQKALSYVIASGVVVFLSLFLLIASKRFRIFQSISKKSPHFWLFFLFLLTSQYLAVLLGLLDFWSLTKITGYLVIGIIGYFILPTVIKKEQIWAFWMFLAVIGGVFSFIGLVIVLRGELNLFGLHWEPTPWLIPTLGIPATQSIFSDSNYFSIIPFFGFLASLYLLRKKKILGKALSCFLLGLNLAGIFLSYSRATYLAILFSFLLWLLIGSTTFKKMTIFFLVILIVTGAFFFTESSPQLQSFLQISKGLSGREILWPAAFEAILEKPILGWGIGNVSNVTQSQELPHLWTSSHNSFLDFAIMAGIPATILYLWVIIVSIKRLYFSQKRNLERKILLSSILGMLVIMQLTTHTLGGISFGSFMFTMLLGFANSWDINNENEKQ